MTWRPDLSKQIRAEFAEAARLRTSRVPDTPPVTPLGARVGDAVREQMRKARRREG